MKGEFEVKPLFEREEREDRTVEWMAALILVAVLFGFAWITFALDQAGVR